MIQFKHVFLLFEIFIAILMAISTILFFTTSSLGKNQVIFYFYPCNLDFAKK